jgi:hypothetical protein
MDAIFHTSTLVPYFTSIITPRQWALLCLNITLEMLFCQMTYQHNFATTCKDNILFPRFVILRIIFLLFFNLLELEVLSSNFCWGWSQWT